MTTTTTHIPFTFAGLDEGLLLLVDDRFEVMTSLAALSDPSHQARCWVDPEAGEAEDSLGEHLDCLYERHHVFPRPDLTVGDVLRHCEVPAMELVARRLGRLVLELGDAPDTVYLADPRWTGVVDAAAKALALMEECTLPVCDHQ